MADDYEKRAERRTRAEEDKADAEEQRTRDSRAHNQEMAEQGRQQLQINAAVGQSEIDRNEKLGEAALHTAKAEAEAKDRVSKAQSRFLDKQGEAEIARSVGKLDDEGVSRVDTYEKNKEDRANIQAIFDILGDCFGTIDEDGSPNENFDIDPYIEINRNKVAAQSSGEDGEEAKSDNWLPTPKGLRSPRTYANITAAMAKLRDIREELQRVRVWDANQSREETIARIDDYLERGKAARKRQAVAYVAEREKEHKKWLLINLVAIPFCFFGIALCYAGLVGYGALIYMAFQNWAMKPSNQRDLERDAGGVEPKISDTKALLGQACLVVGFVAFGVGSFMISDAVSDAEDEALIAENAPLIENKTPLNEAMMGTWQSSNDAKKTITITPIGITQNEGESTRDFKMAGIDCQGDICKFNNGLDYKNRLDNPDSKAYIEGDKLTISGSSWMLNGVWLRSSAKMPEGKAAEKAAKPAREIEETKVEAPQGEQKPIPSAMRGEWWHTKNAAAKNPRCNDEHAKVTVTSKGISWTNSCSFTSEQTASKIKVVDEDGVFTFASGSYNRSDCTGSTLEQIGKNLMISLDCQGEKVSIKASKKVKGRSKLE